MYPDSSQALCVALAIVSLATNGGCVGEDAILDPAGTSASGTGEAASSAGAGGDAGASSTSSGTGAAPDDPLVVRWAKPLTSASGISDATGIATLDGNDALVAGYFSVDLDLGGASVFSHGDKDLFLGRYTHAGGALMSSGGYGDRAEDWALAMGGNARRVAVVGQYDGAPSMGGDPLPTCTAYPNTFVAVYSDADAPLWSVGFCGSDVRDIGAVDVGEDDSVVIAGSFEGGVDLGGGMPLDADGYDDVLVAKFDGTGNLLWAHAYGNEQLAFSVRVAVDEQDMAVYVAGSFNAVIDFGGGPLDAAGPGQTGSDIFVAAFNPDGTHRWSKRLLTEGYATPGALTALPGGGVALIGAATENSAMDFGGGVVAVDGDVFVARFDPLTGDVGGTPRVFEASAAKINMYGLAADALGNLIVSGSVTGTVDFGNGPLTSEGNCAADDHCNDAVIAVLDAGGNAVASRIFGGGPGNDYAAYVSATSTGFFVNGRYTGELALGDLLLPATRDGNIFVARFDLR